MQSLTEQTPSKWPPLLLKATTTSFLVHSFGISIVLKHGLISMFFVCTTLLRECNVLLMKTYNYTYPILEIACYELFQYVDLSDLF